MLLLKLFYLSITAIVGIGCTTTKKRYEGYFENEELRCSYIELKKRVESAPLSEFLKEVKELRKKWPHSLYVQALEVVLEGDASQLVSMHEEAVVKQKAVIKLENLLDKVQHLNPDVLSFLRNEIAYHSGDYYQQYMLGKEQIGPDSGKRGYFSLAVGGSEHAFSLLLQGYIQLARRFASESVTAWEKFSNPIKTGDHFYSQALAIAGYEKKAREAYDKVRASHSKEDELWDKKYGERFKVIKQSFSDNSAEWPPALIVQNQVEAYNRGDVEALLAYYADSIVFNLDIEFKNDAIVGKKALRKQFSKLFEKPSNLHAHIKSRQVIGNRVIDEEITKLSDGRVNRSFFIYTVKDGLISNVLRVD